MVWGGQDLGLEGASAESEPTGLCALLMGQHLPSKSHLLLCRTWPGSSFGFCGNTMR